MSSTYVIDGAKNPSRIGTEEIILEKASDGTVTKSISKTTPAQLNQDELALVQSFGVTVEKISKARADELTAAAAQVAAVGADVAGAAPVFDQGGSSAVTSK